MTTQWDGRMVICQKLSMLRERFDIGYCLSTSFTDGPLNRLRGSAVDQNRIPMRLTDEASEVIKMDRIS